MYQQVVYQHFKVVYQDFIARFKKMWPILKWMLLALAVLVVGAVAVRKFPLLMVLGLRV